MELEEKNNKPDEQLKQTEENSDATLPKKKDVEASSVKTSKRVRKKATADQLSHPLHGIKLKDILERLVARYGWEYLAKEVNIRCFMYNPNMKSSLGFLRKTQWAREHVEDVFMDMLQEDKKK